MDGFPHSEIPGSKPAHGSPGLIAACHVLHRLHAPRHPPNALQTLERYPFNSPPMLRERRSRRTVPPVATGDHGISHFSLHLERGAIAARRPWDAFRQNRGPKPLRHAGTRRAFEPSSQCQSADRPPGEPGEASDRRNGAHPQGPRRSVHRKAALRRTAAPCPSFRVSSSRSGRLPEVPDRCPGHVAGSGGVVEPTGFEPVTPCLQSRRSPS